MGLASCLAVVTLGLALTGRLALYINPSSNWFAIPMAVLVLVGAALSFLLPPGAEEDHGHDHGDASHAPHVPAPPAAAGPRNRTIWPSAHQTGPSFMFSGPDRTISRQGAGRSAGAVVAATGGVAATGVILSILLLPPASLSAEIAQSRDVGAAPLFAGADVVSLATHGDTAKFGVGDWASVFATATNPDAFEGDAVTLTGFATPADGGGFELTRLIITHCVIDAQPASVPVVGSGAAPKTGAWIEVTGTVRSSGSGVLQIAATGVKPIPEPQDPYEY